MKINCIKNSIKEIISLMEKISGKNLTLPILNNVLIFTEGKNLKFRATNLELGIEAEIPAKIEKQGKVAVPAGVIYNFLSSFLGNENITLESINENLSISTESTSILIKGQNANDFPILPSIKDIKPISIKTQDLINGFKSVWYSASNSNIKPEISSVYIFSDQKTNLTFTATDSFRLAEKTFNYNFPEKISLLIPYRNVIEIIRVFENKEGNVELMFDKNQLSISCENINLISRMTDGIFPDYKQIIPNKFTADVIIDKNALSNVIKTAGIFSGRLNELNFIVNGKNDFITVQSSNIETGEYVTKIPANITGEDIKITFNYRYIADCLNFINSQKIILRFSGEGKPLLITGTEDNSFQYLVMPMNTV